MMQCRTASLDRRTILVRSWVVGPLRRPKPISGRQPAVYNNVDDSYLVWHMYHCVSSDVCKSTDGCSH